VLFSNSARSRRPLVFSGLLACCWGAAHAETALTAPSAHRSARTSACSPVPRADSTSFIRQFAKDDPRTRIIVSGPQAASLAKMLYDDITTHRDFKPRKGEDKVVILTLEQAEQAAAQDPKFNDSTRIFLLVTKELKGPLTSALEHACPVDIAQLPEGNGAVMSRNLNPRAGHLAFSMAVVAPDGERLKTLLGLFGQSQSSYQGLLGTVNDKYQTYRLAVFSAEADREAVERWGHLESKNLWSKYEWHPLDAYANLTPEQRDERYMVFFLNRADKNQVVPEPAQALLADRSLKETTSIITKGRGPNGLACAVFSSPTELILHKRAAQYHHFDAIPASAATDDVTDLRFINRTVLLVHGVGLKLTTDDAEGIRFQTAQVMRAQLKLAIEERGAQFEALQKEIAFQDLQGATNAAQKLRQKDGVRYVWLFQVTDYAGKTVYMPDQSSVTQEPPSFTQAHPEDAEPQEPTLGLFVGGGKKAEYERDHAAWKPKHDAWENRKAAYERYVELQYPCSWECKVDKVCTADVRGTLRLIDLDHPNIPVWEKVCSGSSSDRSELTRRTIQIRGTKSRPDSLPCPPNEDVCPGKLLQAAGVIAGTEGIGILQATAWLPDGKAPPPTTDLKESGSRESYKREQPGPSPSPVSKVADVDDNGVTLKIDPEAGVKKGSWIDIPLVVKDITDPDDPSKVIAHKVVEKITLRVVSVHDNTADCVPVSDKEKLKLKRVKAGMVAGSPYRAPVTPPPPPVKPGPKPGTKKKS
jgi:hypothetical protein